MIEVQLTEEFLEWLGGQLDFHDSRDVEGFAQQFISHLYHQGNLRIIERTDVPEKVDNLLNDFEIKLRGVLRTVGASRLWSLQELDGFTLELVSYVRDEVIPHYRRRVSSQELPLSDKPAWWPENPYPQSVFTMPEERYLEIVPDPDLRTGLSGMLGRRFWDIASEAIWEAMQENQQELPLCDCGMGDASMPELHDKSCAITQALAQELDIKKRDGEGDQNGQDSSRQR